MYRVVHTLVRLYTLARIPDRAGYYRRMADNGTARLVILWRARNVLESDEPADGGERRRASQLLIAAAEVLFHTGPFSDGLAFARAAHRLAPLRRDQATALHLSAHHRMQQGEYERARGEFLEVLELYRELGDRAGEAAARHGLAGIDLERGEYERARGEFLEVLELRRELGDRAGEAATRHQLASIDFKQGEYERARGEFLEVLELRRELGDRAGEAATRYLLAGIDFKQGEYERARGSSWRCSSCGASWATVPARLPPATSWPASTSSRASMSARVASSWRCSSCGASWATAPARLPPAT